MFELTVFDSIRDVGESVWRRLTGPEPAPFLSWDFLDSMERTGCVHPEKGWRPFHVLLRRGEDTVGGFAAYLKGNSEGEFVFDHGWARFAEERLGIPYYPKLIVAAPFTPATSSRFFVAPGVDRTTVLSAASQGLAELVARLRLSSAHVLFSPEAEASELEGCGLARRYGIQYHWQNRGYASFEDFLQAFGSKKRNQIRRERRELEKQNIEIQTLDGRDASDAVIDFAFECYRSTVEKHFWGRQYLNREFFHEVSRRLGAGVLIVLATERGSRRPLAAAFNLVGAQGMYGRYWGAVADVPFLHFNVCYYAGVEHCIRMGLPLFEPGAGGEHKVARGFEPAITHSTHLLANPVLDEAVRDALRRERAAVLSHLSEYQCDPVLKPNA